MKKNCSDNGLWESDKEKEQEIVILSHLVISLKAFRSWESQRCVSVSTISIINVL